MAEKTILVDDIDGTYDDVQRVKFGLDGTYYEIDLASGNREGIYEVLGEYIEKGRKKKTGGSRPGTKPSKPHNLDIIIDY